MGVLKSKIKERQLVNTVVSYFKTLEQYRIYNEVAFLSKRIDIVLIDRTTGELYAIETKVNWWKKVIEQAKLNLLCADRVYIALPDRKTHLLDTYKDKLNKYGIGLLSIGSQRKQPRVEEMIRAIPSAYKDNHYAQELKTSIEKGFFMRSTI